MWTGEMDGLLHGFVPLAMRYRNDCGPTAMMQLIRYAYRAGPRRPDSVVVPTGPRRPDSVAVPTGPRRPDSVVVPTGPRRPDSVVVPTGHRHVDYGDMLHVWGFREGADRLDTPGHHLRALRSLGMRFAFRRRLEGGTIARVLDSGSPAALLLPTGAFRWHWIVVCGRTAGGTIVSAGAGSTRLVPRGVLDRVRLRHAASRALGIDGLGYVIAAAGSDGPMALAPDRALERDILRLAALAEEALAPVESRLGSAGRGLVRMFCAKMGWKPTGWGDMLDGDGG